jgi:hypothetical protein
MKSCECGCGAKFPRLDSRGRLRRFAPSHNGNPPRNPNNCPNHAGELLPCNRCVTYKKRRYCSLRAQNKCPNHPTETLPCSTCQDQHRAAYEALRLDVLSHYCNGKPSCQCRGCKISFIGFLCIDHVKGDGHKHLNQRGQRLKGPSLLKWLKRNDYPSGFQVLCANCNQSKKNQSTCALYGHHHK